MAQPKDRSMGRASELAIRNGSSRSGESGLGLDWVWIGVTEHRPQSWRRPPEIDSNRIISMVDQYKESLDGRTRQMTNRSTSPSVPPVIYNPVRPTRINL
jgi:hypothetical protein